jgi:Ran GTPase-activating protein 1
MLRFLQIEWPFWQLGYFPIENIRHLNLSSNFINDDALRILLGAIEDNPVLQDLSLQNNQIDALGANHLSNFLRDNKHLQKLNLTDNRLLDGDDWATLAGAIRVNQALQGLAVSWAVSTWMQLLMQRPLKLLIVSQDQEINPPAASFIHEAIVNNLHIKTLSLIDAAIGDLGAALLAEALRSPTNLESLFLEGNNIQDAGAASIGMALGLNTSLILLKLKGNKISDLGAKHLANGLKVNHTLHSLNLYDNQIHLEGARALISALKVNEALSYLGLGLIEGWTPPAEEEPFGMRRKFGTFTQLLSFWSASKPQFGKKSCVEMLPHPVFLLISKMVVTQEPIKRVCFENSAIFSGFDSPIPHFR